MKIECHGNLATLYLWPVHNFVLFTQIIWNMFHLFLFTIIVTAFLLHIHAFEDLTIQPFFESTFVISCTLLLLILNLTTK